MNYKSILFYIGIFSLLVALFSIFNILYTIYFIYYIDLNSYIITFILSFVFGSFFCYIGKKDSNRILLSEQIIFILLSFILIPALISINAIVPNKNHASPLFLRVNASPKIHNPELKIKIPKIDKTNHLFFLLKFTI